MTHYDSTAHNDTLATLATRKVIALDVDGTLVETFTSTELKPHVKIALERIVEHYPHMQFAFVTNQGGPACLDAPWNLDEDGQPKKQYPSVSDVNDRIGNIRQQVEKIVGREIEVYMSLVYQGKDGETFLPRGLSFEPHSPTDPDWRKPQPGMLYSIQNDYKVRSSEIIMIGDSSADWDAADAAGIDSMSAWSLEQLGRSQYHLKITINEGMLWGWMEDHELIGLDIEATKQAARKELNFDSYSYISAVTIDFHDDDDEELPIIVQPNALENDTLIRNKIRDLFVNYTFLRYTGPEAHALALACTKNNTIRSILALTIHREYEVPIMEARQLVDTSREEFESNNPEVFVRRQLRRDINTVHAIALTKDYNLTADEKKVFLTAANILREKLEKI